MPVRLVFLTLVLPDLLPDSSSSDFITPPPPAVMRLAAAKLPCTSEVIDKSSVARLGFADVEPERHLPRVTTLGAVQRAAQQAQADEGGAAPASV